MKIYKKKTIFFNTFSLYILCDEEVKKKNGEKICGTLQYWNSYNNFNFIDIKL